MKTLTHRQAQILSCIEAHQVDLDIIITGNFIATETGIPRSTTYRHLRELVKDGWLYRSTLGYRLNEQPRIEWIDWILDYLGRWWGHPAIRAKVEAWYWRMAVSVNGRR